MSYFNIIELSSNSLKVINTSENKVVYLCSSPINIIDLETGKINVRIFKKKILNNFKAYYKNKLKSRKSICFMTGIYCNSSNSNTIKEILKGLNINVVLLDSKEEIMLSYNSLNCISEPIIYIDLGGGTTDFAFIKDNNIKKQQTLNFGGVHLLILFLNQRSDNFEERIEIFKNLITSFLAVNKNQLKELFTNSNSVVISSSVTKNISDDFFNEEYLLKTSLINYMEDKMKINAKNLFKTYLIDENQDLFLLKIYLTGIYLDIILSEIGIEKFQINRRGLHYSLKSYIDESNL